MTSKAMRNLLQDLRQSQFFTPDVRSVLQIVRENPGTIPSHIRALWYLHTQRTGSQNQNPASISGLPPLSDLVKLRLVDIVQVDKSAMARAGFQDEAVVTLGPTGREWIRSEASIAGVTLTPEYIKSLSRSVVDLPLQVILHRLVVADFVLRVATRQAQRGDRSHPVVMG